MGTCTIRKRVDIVGIPVEDIERFHALWISLHAEVRTADQFEAWTKRVPSFGCSCASWLKDYLAKNPVPDTGLAEYGWTLHNAVNQKLGKSEFTWAEFETKYG
tara:strand:+ start:15261 stop:15569 length:309 start_codon:yes stop_codon:yes gene_type:complete